MRTLLIAAVFAALFLPETAAGQAVWTDRAHVVKQLAHAYSEAPRALGITAAGGVLELFTSGAGETWTVIVTLPNGMSRIVATGEHWIILKPDSKGPKT